MIEHTHCRRCGHTIDKGQPGHPDITDCFGTMRLEILILAHVVEKLQKMILDRHP